MDPTLLVVIGVQVLAVGITLVFVGPRLIRRWPGTGAAVILGRTLGVVVGIALVALAYYGGATPMSNTANPNPATVTSVTAGAGLYQANCAMCHGVDGRGGGPLAGTTHIPPPSLVDHAGAHPDGDLYFWIQNGLPGGMPAFSDRLTPSQTWDLVNYLRSIQR